MANWGKMWITTRGTHDSWLDKRLDGYLDSKIIEEICKPVDYTKNQINNYPITKQIGNLINEVNKLKEKNEMGERKYNEMYNGVVSIDQKSDVIWRVNDVSVYRDTGSPYGIPQVDIEAKLIGIPKNVHMYYDSKKLHNELQNALDNRNGMPQIEKVIFNKPATIIIWKDGTKTVVKRQKGDRWDPEKGFAMAYLKKLLGNDNTFNKEVHKWVKEDQPNET